MQLLKYTASYLTHSAVDRYYNHVINQNQSVQSNDLQLSVEIREGIRQKSQYGIQTVDNEEWALPGCSLLFSISI